MINYDIQMPNIEKIIILKFQIMTLKKKDTYAPKCPTSLNARQGYTHADKILE